MSDPLLFRIFFGDPLVATVFSPGVFVRLEKQDLR